MPAHDQEPVDDYLNKKLIDKLNASTHEGKTAQQWFALHEVLRKDLERVVTERDGYKAERDALSVVLGQVLDAGGAGHSENVVVMTRRIIAERDEAKRQHQKLQLQLDTAGCKRPYRPSSTIEDI
jgi:hypothetical protein